MTTSNLTNGPDASEAGEGGRLESTMQVIRERDAQQGDVLGEVRDSQKGRLELLKHEIRDVIADVPREVDIFDFRIVSTEPPRFWIDATTFVVIAKGNTGYRMLKDTRAGRILLRESVERGPMADAIIQYVAERLAQRERAMEGEYYGGKMQKPLPVVAPSSTDPASSRSDIADGEGSTSTKRSGRPLLWFLLGVLVGAGGLFAFAWYRKDLGF